MKRVVLIIVMGIFLFFLVNGFIYYSEMLEQAKKIKEDVSVFIILKGGYPDDIKEVYPNAYADDYEMFKEPSMKFRFYYGYDIYANGYIVVIDSWNPPNLIYFFCDDKMDFNSRHFFIRGL